VFFTGYPYKRLHGVDQGCFTVKKNLRTLRRCLRKKSCRQVLRLVWENPRVLRTFFLELQDLGNDGRNFGRVQSFFVAKEGVALDQRFFVVKEGVAWTKDSS